MNTGATLLQFPRIADERGVLTVGEFGKELPFAPVRYFAITDVPPGMVRGRHAHRACHQLFVVLHGACDIVLDNGSSRDNVRLDSPAIGLHVPPLVWNEVSNHTPGAVMLVLTSHVYDQADYIRSYEEFRTLVRTQ